MARIYDAEIQPVWAERFSRMLLRDLDVPPRGQVLDCACGTGNTSAEILRRIGDDCRLIAIEPSSAMLDVARKKIHELGRKSVFFRTESVAPKLSFANDVYDLVICNLALPQMPDPAAAVADFARVATPGGQVRCSLPMQGTFQEFYDIYREVLIKHDKHDAIDRLNQHLKVYPSAELCESWLRDAGLVDIHVDIEEFSMLFRSSREFFFAPVIEYGPLLTWKAIAGMGQEMQDVFWYIKEAIDAYYGSRAFEVRVKACALRGTKVDTEPVIVLGEADRARQSGRQSNRALEERDTGRIRVGDIHRAAGDGSLPEVSTEEIELQDIEEVRDSDDHIADAEAGLADGLTADSRFDEIEIEAFIEGAERPPHLDKS